MKQASSTVEKLQATGQPCRSPGISTQESIAHDPDFDSLRDDPQFQALLARRA